LDDLHFAREKSTVHGLMLVAKQRDPVVSRQASGLVWLTLRRFKVKVTSWGLGIWMIFLIWTQHWILM